MDTLNIVSLFTSELGVSYLMRWGHFLAGVAWIGLLYYFNFVQTEYFKVAEPAARTDAFVKLVPKALLWFRMAAAVTFLTGLVMLGLKGAGLSLDIVIGATLGTLMFLNVWLIIWPNQRILIASNEQVKGGGQALPEAAAAAPKAGIASRTNTMFSVPMLFFMGSSAHFSNTAFADASMAALGVVLVIIAALQANAILRTNQGPMASVKGVIGCGFALWLVLYSVVSFVP